MPNPFLEPIEMLTIDTVPVHLYVQQMLSEYPGLADNSQLKALRTHTVEAMVMQLISWCASGRIPDSTRTETFSYPDGVWQMFKDRHMPEWYKKRFPVRIKKETFKVETNHYFVCPHLKSTHKNEHIRFMATGTQIASKIGTDPTTW